MQCSTSRSNSTWLAACGCLHLHQQRRNTPNRLWTLDKAIHDKDIGSSVSSEHQSPRFLCYLFVRLMHDSSGSVSTENEDAAKKLKIGNNKDSNNSNESHAAAQLTKDVQAEQSEVSGLDRNGSEKRIGPMEIGLQTQQSGSLNGGNDTVMAEEAEEASVDQALGTTSGEGSHKIQSTPETENAGDEDVMELEETGGGGSPSAFNSEGLNGEGPVSAADSLSRASTDANGNGQAKAPAAAPPPPVLKGLLCTDVLSGL